MKNKLLTLLVALIVTFSLSYVVMAKTQDADKNQKNEVVSQEVVADADASDLSLDEDALTLEPGDTATITGTLEDEDLDIDKVEWEIDGADILDIDIDKDNNTFEAAIKIDNNADDGDECTITFTVTDQNNDTYEAECDITIEEDNDGLDLNKESLTLEPGDEETIKGILDDEDLDIDKVEIDIDGDQVIDVDIDKDNNKFEATIKVDDDADDGDECTITFKVTDSEDKVYEESVDIVINADDQDDEDVDEDNDNDNDNDNIDKSEKTNCPAAPAIANKILKENGIKNKNKETGVNYISQIAKQKGKGASFNGVSKKDKQDYEDAIRDYLEDECDLDLDD